MHRTRFRQVGDINRKTFSAKLSQAYSWQVALLRLSYKAT